MISLLFYAKSKEMAVIGMKISSLLGRSFSGISYNMQAL
jgi:hypothetical protein